MHLIRLEVKGNDTEVRKKMGELGERSERYFNLLYLSCSVWVHYAVLDRFTFAVCFVILFKRLFELQRASSLFFSTSYRTVNKTFHATVLSQSFFFFLSAPILPVVRTKYPVEGSQREEILSVSFPALLFSTTISLNFASIVL